MGKRLVRNPECSEEEDPRRLIPLLALWPLLCASLCLGPLHRAHQGHLCFWQRLSGLKRTDCREMKYPHPSAHGDMAVAMHRTTKDYRVMDITGKK